MEDTGSWRPALSEVEGLGVTVGVDNINPISWKLEVGGWRLP